MFTLYHVTLAMVADHILLTGVDPEFSTGNLDASWWVTEDRLEWAVIHVANRHKVMVADLVVFSFTPGEYQSKFKRSRLAGVYWTKEMIEPHTLTPAMTLIDGLASLPEQDRVEEIPF